MIGEINIPLMKNNPEKYKVYLQETKAEVPTDYQNFYPQNLKIKQSLDQDV